jgi:hypothetical protein
MKHSLITLILCTTAFCTYADQDTFLIIPPRGNQSRTICWSGFFANFLAVIAGLDIYETKGYGGCGVEFPYGIYLDPAVGSNWWEYYFEPININYELRTKKPQYMTEEMKVNGANHVISSMSRERASELIKRYIHIKPHVQQKIDDFITHHFDGHFIIGIHYRGTDKHDEAPPVPYETFYQKLTEIIEEHKSDDYCVFIATDEAAFIDYIKEKVDSTKLCYTCAIRSLTGKPVHGLDQVRDPYQLGEDALIDCLLLSHCSVLIRNWSVLGSTAANINPDLPVISLNRPYMSKKIPNVR